MKLSFVTIDFETRSAIPIKAGASRYSKDCEVMCLSYQFANDSEVFSWAPGEPAPDRLLGAVKGGCLVHAHNASFEICVWQNVMVAKHGWPEIPLENWRCTAAEAMYSGLPGSLEQAAIALGLEVEKDMKGRRLMQKMSKPRKPTKKDKSVWHEKPEQVQRLRDYCDQDVRTEYAIHCAIPRLTTSEQSVYRHDRKVNQRGVSIDVDLAESAVDLWRQYSDIVNHRVREESFGLINSTDQTREIVALANSLGCPLPDLTKNTVTDFLKQDLSPTVRMLLQSRQDLALASIAKYKKMLLCVEEDDRIRGCIQYHGAQATGRYAGRLAQLQNLPRGCVHHNDYESLINLAKTRDLDTVQQELSSRDDGLTLGDMLSSLLRPTIKAAKGKKLIVCDFASVEARGAAWAAGEDWLLDAFRDGQDCYVLMASDIYKIKPEEVTKTQRFYGKTAVLGCGYQLGARGMQAQLINFGVEEDLEFCERIVKAYRKKNVAIRDFWYRIEAAAVKCVDIKKPIKCDPYTFHLKGDWLKVRLPSGRDISMYKPELFSGKFGTQLKYVGVNERGQPFEKRTYGGMLTENVTQAICRDLLVEAMARLELAGYPVIAHVHDEVIVEVDEDFGSIDEVKEIMNYTPEWAEGFPVSSEGFESKRFRKD